MIGLPVRVMEMSWTPRRDVRRLPDAVDTRVVHRRHWEVGEAMHFCIVAISMHNIASW